MSGFDYVMATICLVMLALLVYAAYVYIKESRRLKRCGSNGDSEWTKEEEKDAFLTTSKFQSAHIIGRDR